MRRFDDLYYSSFHLARDVVGNVAPVTFAVALGAVFFDEARQPLLDIAQYLASVQSWVVASLWTAAYTLTATVAGIVAEKAAIIARNLYRSILKSLGRDIEWWQRYAASADAIDALYRRYLVEGVRDLRIEPHPGNTDVVEKVDRLVAYFKLHDPRGYQHLYRDYMLVTMTRQCWIYACALALRASFTGRYVLAAGLWSFVVLLLWATGTAVRAAVDNEYQYIAATATSLSTARQRPVAARSAPHATKTDERRQQAEGTDA